MHEKRDDEECDATDDAMKYRSPVHKKLRYSLSCKIKYKERSKYCCWAHYFSIALLFCRFLCGYCYIIYWNTY